MRMRNGRFFRRLLTTAAVAGAMSLTPPGQAAIVTVDNTDSGFTVLSQAWSISTSNAGYFGTNYAFRAGSATMNIGSVQWQPNLPQAGSYEVAVWYNLGTTPTTSRANDVKYTVNYSGGSTQITVSQQVQGMRWFVLGTFPFVAGTSGTVTMTSQTSNSGTRNIIADAVRFRTLPQTFMEMGQAVLGGLELDARSASFADIDNDGDEDVLIQTPSARVLLRNNTIGAGTADFTNISSMLHPLGTSSWSAAWGDYDGDGDVDVFVGQTNSSTTTGALLRNDGAAGFNDVSVTTGLDDPGFAQNVAWSDIDRDGDLDLLIAMEGPELHEIYMQGPPGTFTPVGAAAGFQVPVGIKSYGMAIGDTDGDGDNDIYISTCRGDNNIRNNFFKSMLVETSTLSLVDIADTNGTQFMNNSYDAEFHDFDNDGDLDLFMAGADGELSKIFRNDGNNQFTDIDAVTGHALLSDTGGDLNGAKVLDYDNDGDLDLWLHDHLVANGKNHARLLYRNDGNWTFTNVTVAEGLDEANVTNSNAGYDGSWADFDRDGDLDLLDTAGSISSFAQPQRFFVSNVSTNGNHWLFVRLKGMGVNTTAIGAQLYATLHQGTPQQITLRRDANANAGTFNQSDVPVHFGLGSATVVDQLRIVWPNGVTRTHLNIPADHHVTISLCPRSDFDRDLDVDDQDMDHLRDCRTRSTVLNLPPGCADADYDNDGDSDQDDFGEFQLCHSGDGHPQTATPCLTEPTLD